MNIVRCPWSKGELYHRYHDLQWGVPEYDDRMLFEIPSWRNDVLREIDLIEEIARLYGVERIPSTAPRGAIAIAATGSPQAVRMAGRTNCS